MDDKFDETLKRSLGHSIYVQVDGTDGQILVAGAYFLTPTEADNLADILKRAATHSRQKFGAGEAHAV